MNGLAGSTLECLQHYVAGAGEVGIGHLVTFAHVHERTPEQWVAGTLPKGVSLITLRVFLTDHGYDVEEFSNLPSITQAVARLMGYHILTLDEVRVGLGYKHSQQLFRVTLRGHGLAEHRQDKMATLVRKHREQLDRAIADWRLGPPPKRPVPPADPPSDTGRDRPAVPVAVMPVHAAPGLPLLDKGEIAATPYGGIAVAIAHAAIGLEELLRLAGAHPESDRLRKQLVSFVGSIRIESLANLVMELLE